MKLEKRTRIVDGRQMTFLVTIDENGEYVSWVWENPDRTSVDANRFAPRDQENLDPYGPGNGPLTEGK